MTWVTIKEASQITGVPDNTIRWYVNKRYIETIYDAVIKVNIEELKKYIKEKNKKVSYNPFAYSYPKENENYRPLFTLQQGKIDFPHHKFFVGSEGSIWNLSTAKIIGGNKPDSNGHLQVLINKKCYYVHKLVASVWCPNRLFKQIVHHINCNKLDNRCENLLYVTIKEHAKLHKLFNDEKIEEYNAMVDKIRVDNSWQNCKNLYAIIDEELSDDKCFVTFWVDYDGWCRLLRGDIIDNLIKDKMIIMQSAHKNECKKIQGGGLNNE